MNHKFLVGIFALLSLPAFADHADHSKPTGFIPHLTDSPYAQNLRYDADSATVDVLESAPKGECFAKFTIIDQDIADGAANHYQVQSNEESPILRHHYEKKQVCLHDLPSRTAFDYETQTRHALGIEICDCGDFYEECDQKERAQSSDVCGGHPDEWTTQFTFYVNVLDDVDEPPAESPADLSVNLTVDNSEPEPGEPFTLTAVVRNDGGIMQQPAILHIRYEPDDRLVVQAPIEILDTGDEQSEPSHAEVWSTPNSYCYIATVYLAGENNTSNNEDRLCVAVKEELPPPPEPTDPEPTDPEPTNPEPEPIDLPEPEPSTIGKAIVIPLSQITTRTSAWRHVINEE